MNSMIITEGNMKKAVFLKVENEDAQFIGIVKSNVSMTKIMEEVANKVISTLYDIWTQRYDRINWITQESEFRYKALAKALITAWDYEKLIDPQKVCMSLTAICNFPKKKKAFWINTGCDMVYTSGGGKVLNRLCTNTKKLKTFKEQSIFTRDPDYFFKVEGAVIKSPKNMFIVSSDAVKYFEECMEGGISFSHEGLEGFSHGKRNPIIIGEISANN